MRSEYRKTRRWQGLAGCCPHSAFRLPQTLNATTRPARAWPRTRIFLSQRSRSTQRIAPTISVVAGETSVHRADHAREAGSEGGLSACSACFARNSSACRLPLSAGRLPLSALRTPHSAFRCPLSALRTPLSAFRSPLAACRFPLSALRSPHSAVRSPLSAFRWPHSAVRSPLSAVRSPLSAFRFPLSAVRSPLSAFRCPLSAFRWPLSALRTPHSALRIPLSANAERNNPATRQARPFPYRALERRSSPPIIYT